MAADRNEEIRDACKLACVPSKLEPISTMRDHAIRIMLLGTSYLLSYRRSLVMDIPLGDMGAATYKSRRCSDDEFRPWT